MTKKIGRWISLCLLLVLLAQLLPLTPTAALEAVSYGEAYLDLQTDAQRAAYILLEEGIASLAPSIQFTGQVVIAYGPFMDVIRAVCVDHPQYFWFLEDGVCYYEIPTAQGHDIVASFEPYYILNGSRISAGSQELADAMDAFHTRLHQIVDGIPMNLTTEYEIALYLHDYLADAVTYTLEGEHPSAYAALVKGEAACYGYSKAYQCLLNAAGVRARTLTGNSADEAGNLTGHAWNLVWLDGQCCYVDVTWDDWETVTMHDYFALSLETISKDHFPEKEFILPDCGHSQWSYYSRSHGSGVGRWSEHTVPADAAACFRLVEMGENGGEFSCEVQFASAGFWNWFDWRYWEILDAMGLSESTQIYYYSAGNVYYLTLIDPTCRQPQVTGISLAAEAISLPGPGARYQLQPEIQTPSQWKPHLVYTSSDPTVATVDASGVVTAVAQGEAVITVGSADGTVSAHCSVSVAEAPEHKHTMRLFPRADATCTQEGHEAYYLCTDCGRRFADEAGALAYGQVSEYTIPITHKKLVYISQGGYHVQQCKCGVKLTETQQKHTDADGDGICEVCQLSVQTLDFDTPDQDEGPGFVLPAAIGVAAALVAAVLFFVIRRRIRGY